MGRREGEEGRRRRGGREEVGRREGRGTEEGRREGGHYYTNVDIIYNTILHNMTYM